MKITMSQFRQLIREEIQKITLTEAPKKQEKDHLGIPLYQAAGNNPKAFYTFFSGKQAIQGDALDRVKDVAKEGMDPDDLKNIGDCYETKVGKYTVYVITHAKKPKDKWCVITPYDAELLYAEDSDPICRKAMATPGKPISFQDILKK